MAVSFDIDFSKTTEGINSLQKSLNELASKAGKNSDLMEAWASKLDFDLVQVERKFQALADSNDTLRAKMQAFTRMTAYTTFLEGVQTASHKASLGLAGVRDTTEGVGNTLRQTARDNLMAKTLLNISTSSTKAAATQHELRNALMQVGDANVKANADLKREISTREELRDSTHKMEQALIRLKNAREQMHSPIAQQLRDEQVAYDLDKKKLSLTSEITKRMNATKVAQEQLNSAEYQAVVNAEEKVRALEQVIRAEAKQAAELLKINKQMELSRNTDSKDLEQAKRRLIVQRESQRADEAHTDVLRKKVQEVSKLAAEVAYLGSEEGRRHIAQMNQLNEEKKKILETAEAHKRKQKQTRITTQMTAAWRATLQGAQSSIGMYTSSTILMASAMYTLSRTMRSTLTMGKDFGYEMAMAQAVTGAAGYEFQNVEKQVRSLGQTTVFTASEVSRAATELGLAGLTAGQTVAALAPTLNLAAIGGLEMGKAADHATNMMMVFNKEVSDLSGVVDVMATAVTNANTNVDQLANALTYAGPAAASVGYSMEETTAAVATLANQGIKASRAGTALRRLFVNLHNPTARGRKVMEEFNIQVNNLDGSARSLEDVLGQLSNAMKGLPGPERLKAVQDLVGVYATSTISALIGANDQFGLLNDQMSIATGNAEKMKEQLQQAFEFDWRELKSGFQEIQLQIFDMALPELRLRVKEVTLALLEFTEPMEDGISSLDRWFDLVGTGFKVVGAGMTLFTARWLALRVLQSQSLATTLANTKAAAGHAVALGRGAAATGVFTMQTIRAGGAQKAFTLDLIRTTAALAAQEKAMLAVRAVGAALISPAGIASMVGLAATAYMFGGTLKDIFVKKDIADGIDDHAAKLDSLAERYDAVDAKAKKLQEAKQIKTMEAQVKLVKEQLEDNSYILQNYAKIKAELDGMVERGEALSELQKSQLRDANARVKLYQDLLDKGRKELSLLDNQLLAEEKRAKTRQQLEAEHSKLLKEQFTIEQKLARLRAMPGMGVERIDGKTLRGAELEQHYEEQRRQIVASSALVKAQLQDISRESFDVAKVNGHMAEQILKLGQEFEVSGSNWVEKWKDTEVQSAKLNQRMNVLLEQSKTSVGLTQEEGEELSNIYLQLVNIAKVRHGMLDDQKKVIEENQKLFADYEFSKLSSAQQELQTKEKLARVEKEISELRSTSVYDPEYMNALLKEEKDLRGRVPRDRKAPAERPDRAVQEAIRTWEQLHQKIDKAGHAQAEFEKKAAQLQLLANTAIEKGGITTEQYNKGMVELRKNLFDSLAVAGELQDKIDAVFNRYFANPYQQQADDIAMLSEALKKGVIDADEYARAMERIRKSMRDDIKANAPDLGISLTPNSGMFSEFLKTSVDIANAEKQWSEFQDKLFAGMNQAAMVEHDLHQRKMAALEEQFAQEAILQADYNTQKELEEQRHQQAMMALKEEAEVASKEIIVRSEEFERQSRLMGMASMAGSMASLLGMIADAGEEATTAQKAAFVAQQALAVAQIIMNTEAAAMKAQNEGGTYMGMGLAAMIRAQGYASAGLVAALAINKVSGGSGAKDSNFAGAYDKGGYIPQGKFGIVGEYGPEIVNGPAHVTGREETARRLSQAGGGDRYTVAPVIQIEYKTEGGESPSDQQRSANILASTIEAVVVKTITREMRPNGLLSKRG